MSLGVAFKPDSFLRYKSALKRLKRMAIIMASDLPRRLAQRYALFVAQAITTQKYAASYAPYSPAYERWKYTTMGYTGGFWELRGYVLRYLQAWPVGSYKWKGGIPSSIMVPKVGGGSISLASYAVENEYGTRKVPARPLFGPSLVDFSVTDAISELNESRLKMRGAWR